MSEQYEAANVAPGVPISLHPLQVEVRGQVLQPGDAGYDEARRVYNAMIDRHPSVIVRCADAADVVSAVNFAREHNLTVSVRGGGHNVGGFAVNDGGMVIDLSRMKGIRVDPTQRTVRAEGGVTWGDLDHATHRFGYAVPGGIVSTTGIAGLTLGGGVGNLTRPYGLTCDSVLAVDIVTADGQFLTASADEHADLFWAIRGGGGNFGVVTSFLYRMHPLSVAIGGPVFYASEKIGDAMRFYRDYLATAPTELNAYFGLHILPPAPHIPESLQGKYVGMIFVCYVGPQEQADSVVGPIRAFGPPLLDLVAPVPYPVLNTAFDAVLPPGLQHYWKADFATGLSDEAIDVHLHYGRQIPTFQSGMHLYPCNGAAHTVAKDATAFNWRDAEFVYNVVAVGPDREGNERRIAWAREYWSALRPYAAGGSYVNFLMDEGADRVKATYRDNYDRLVALKNTFDPTNLFHVNQNIKPTGQPERPDAAPGRETPRH